MVAEASLHGVPEFELRDDVHHFVEQLKKRMTGYILINKSENPSDQREAIDAMNDVCKELEDTVYDQVDGMLFDFMRRV